MEASGLKTIYGAVELLKYSLIILDVYKGKMKIKRGLTVKCTGVTCVRVVRDHNSLLLKVRSSRKMQANCRSSG